MTHYQTDIDRAFGGFDFAHRADLLAYTFVQRTKGEKFTAEDVRRFAAGRKVEAIEPRAWGAVMQRLHRAGLIKPAGWTETGNRQAHGRRVRLWRAK